MKVNELRRVFKYLNFLTVEKYLIFSDEIYDTEEDNTIEFSCLEGMLAYKFNDGETVSDKLDKIDIEYVY